MAELSQAAKEPGAPRRRGYAGSRLM